MFKFIEAYFLTSKDQKQTESASAHASDMAEKLTSHIAHKINNPLAIIMTCTEQLRNGLSHQEVNKESLEEQILKIEATVMRISHTIDNFKRSDDEIPPTLP